MVLCFLADCCADLSVYVSLRVTGVELFAYYLCRCGGEAEGVYDENMVSLVGTSQRYRYRNLRMTDSLLSYGEISVSAFFRLLDRYRSLLPTRRVFRHLSSSHSTTVPRASSDSTLDSEIPGVCNNVKDAITLTSTSPHALHSFQPRSLARSSYIWHSRV